MNNTYNTLFGDTRIYMHAETLISSIKEPRVAEARELRSAAGRTRLGKCLLEGTQALQWAIEMAFPIEHVFYLPEQHIAELHTSLREHGIASYPTTPGVLKKISDTNYVIPYIAVARLPESTMQPIGDFVLVLDRVVDHGNIGTIIRTASAFGIHDLISTTPDLDLYYKKIIDASRGRVFTTHLQRFSSGAEALAHLKRQGYQVIATSPHAHDLQAMTPLRPGPVALVVGNETEGIAEDIVANADIVVQIPMSGQVESLNVGVATGISLYELKFRMVLTMLIDYIRSNLGREVNVTGKLIMQAFDRHIQQTSDLTGQQAILLMILVCDQQMTLTQVTRDTGLEGEERNALLQSLIARGYIRHRDDDPQIIMPTPGAEQAIAQLWTIVERAEQAILTGFSPQEVDQFKDFLRRIQENCQRIANAHEPTHAQNI